MPDSFELPFPIDSISSHFGPRLINPETGELIPLWGDQLALSRGVWEEHMAIDYRQPEGTPIHCPADGVVSLVTENEDAAGYSVWIQHGEHGAVMSVSCHLMERSPLEVGEEVLQGQLIGLVGDTGNSFGSHLHFETMVCGEHYNPVTVSKKWDTYFSVDWPSNANTQEELNGRDISE